MRAHNELIQVCLDNFDECFRTGLCSMFDVMQRKELIDRFEHKYLDKYLQHHQPKYHDSVDDIGSFLWPVCNKDERIEWLKQQLILKSNEQSI